jgi:hypothetical protein
MEVTEDHLMEVQDHLQDVPTDHLHEVLMDLHLEMLMDLHPEVLMDVSFISLCAVISVRSARTGSGTDGATISSKPCSTGFG